MVIPLTNVAYEKIKGMIIDFHLRPGEIIFTQQLAEQLGLSRTPVREALVKLAQEGLVTQTDSRKFKIAEITVDSMNNIYDIREAFEEFSIKKIINQLSDESIENLENNCLMLKKAFENNDDDEFFRLDNEFHSYLTKLCNNPMLDSFVAQLLDKQQRIRYFTKYVSNRMKNTISEHEKLVQALKAKNLKESCEASAFHINEVRHGVTDLLKRTDVSLISHMKDINEMMTNFMENRNENKS